MQKFSEFVKDYKQWRLEEKKDSSLLTKREVRGLRKDYESLNSKSIESTSKLDEAFKAEVASFKEWKQKNKLGDDVTIREQRAIRSKLINKMNEAKNTNTPKEPANKENGHVQFKSFVNSYREWKLDNKGTSRLTEEEKQTLKDKYFGKSTKIEESKKASDTRFEEACNGYVAWKIQNGKGKELSESEKAVIAHSIKVDDINQKLSEAKKHIHEARLHMIEGDAMDGAASVQNAGADVNAAQTMANSVTAGDPNATPLPQNIVDEISQIKASIDSLATEAGIESPVDLGANPDAGVPAVTGASDPNAVAAPAAPVDPNAVAPQAPIAESTVVDNAKSRLTEKADVAKDTGLAKDDLVKVPPVSELIAGTKKGPAKAGNVWPTKVITEPKKQSLGNVEESVEQQQAKQVLDESGEFSWSNFLKMRRESR